jgi:hypothetical protein
MQQVRCTPGLFRQAGKNTQVRKKLHVVGGPQYNRDHPSGEDTVRQICEADFGFWWNGYFKPLKPDSQTLCDPGAERATEPIQSPKAFMGMQVE